MNKQDVEKITTEYLKPIFGFALKRCQSPEDAEDLTHDIIIKVYSSLIKREDIEDISKFVWTVAHNCLSNYYRYKQKRIAENIENSFYIVDEINQEPSSSLIYKEDIHKLQSEISFLSKLQRRIIIAYYYENKKQDEISRELDIPIGTVKWHLFEAKKELKRGLETMREPKELKFNPIKFDKHIIINKTTKEEDIVTGLNSLLAQNIIYSVKNEYKTAKEIAIELGVSPVYVENEAEHLERYGYLLYKKGKYISNILINEFTDEITKAHDEMYIAVAKVFANELYDKLIKSSLLESEYIIGGFNGDISSNNATIDKNFLLWALIPYILYESGKDFKNTDIDFSEVSTIRPNGDEDICCVNIAHSNTNLPIYNDSLKAFKGPFANEKLWTIDSEWSEKRNINTISVIGHSFFLNLLLRYKHLDEEKYYAMLAQNGYIYVNKLNDSTCETALRAIYIKDKSVQLKLLNIGDEIRKNHKDLFDKIKKTYIKAILKTTPKHLHKTRLYIIQNIFLEDPWLVVHCLKELINNGKLSTPNENQRLPLSTLIFNSAEEEKN